MPGVLEVGGAFVGTERINQLADAVAAQCRVADVAPPPRPISPRWTA
jgi:hypothetical protein